MKAIVPVDRNNVRMSSVFWFHTLSTFGIAAHFVLISAKGVADENTTYERDELEELVRGVSDLIHDHWKTVRDIGSLSAGHALMLSCPILGDRCLPFSLRLAHPTGLKNIPRPRCTMTRPALSQQFHHQTTSYLDCGRLPYDNASNHSSAILPHFGEWVISWIAVDQAPTFDDGIRNVHPGSCAVSANCRS